MRRRGIRRPCAPLSKRSAPPRPRKSAGGAVKSRTADRRSADRRTSPAMLRTDRRRRIPRTSRRPAEKRFPSFELTPAVKLLAVRDLRPLPGSPTYSSTGPRLLRTNPARRFKQPDGSGLQSRAPAVPDTGMQRSGASCGIRPPPPTGRISAPPAAVPELPADTGRLRTVAVAAARSRTPPRFLPEGGRVSLPSGSAPVRPPGNATVASAPYFPVFAHDLRLHERHMSSHRPGAPA